jgi:hypothetical protein
MSNSHVLFFSEGSPHRSFFSHVRVQDYRKHWLPHGRIDRQVVDSPQSKTIASDSQFRVHQLTVEFKSHECAVRLMSSNSNLDMTCQFTCSRSDLQISAKCTLRKLLSGFLHALQFLQGESKVYSFISVSIQKLISVFSCDDEKGPQLFKIDSSGMYFPYKVPMPPFTNIPEQSLNFYHTRGLLRVQKLMKRRTFWRSVFRLSLTHLMMTQFSLRSCACNM